MENRLEYLYRRWNSQQLTSEEREEYFSLLERVDVDEVLGPLMVKSWAASTDDGALSPEQRRTMAAAILTGKERVKPARMRYLRWAAAAAAVLLLAGVSYRWLVPVSGKHTVAPVADIAPGSNGAVLTLGDGSKVVLDSVADGVVAQQKGANAVMKNGQLAYQTEAAGKGGAEVIYNTVSTPRGRQFNMKLPDGTRVWMNAATVMRYPTAFSGNERIVEVTGEAYFEVAQDKNKPFSVRFLSSVEGGREGIVKALGTEFNVCAYRDDPAAMVTLLGGKVMVLPSPNSEQNSILTPGRQASVFYGKSRNAGMTVQTADTARVMAWKNGMLNLHNLSLTEVMKQISRWYNIDVVYEDKVPEITFWGEISRSENLSTVLSFMAESGVKFKIEDGGKKLIVGK